MFFGTHAYSLRTGTSFAPVGGIVAANSVAELKNAPKVSQCCQVVLKERESAFTCRIALAKVMLNSDYPWVSEL